LVRSQGALYTDATQTPNNPAKEIKMRDKKKKTKTIKVQDLKPKKDAKGGVQVDVSVSGHGVQSHNMGHRGVQRPGRGG